MNVLRRKNIMDSLVYTHLVNVKDDEYVCKTAKPVDEAKALIESGFE